MTHESDGQISRRRILQGGAAAAGFAALGSGFLAACARVEEGAGGQNPGGASPSPQATSGTSGDFEGRTLTILTYSGINETVWRDNFAPQFKEATGADVIVDAAWTEGIAQLQTAGDSPPFQIMMTDPMQGYPARDEGLFRNIDLGALDNLNKFHPNIVQGRAVEEEFAVPFISSAMTLAWNTERVPEGLERWGQLLDSPLRGDMMLYNLYYMSLYTFAAIRADVEGAVGSASDMVRDDLDGVLAFAKENRDAVSYWWPSTADAVNALIGGNVSAGNIHGNGLLAPARDGEPVAGTIPEGDVAYVQLFLAVPAGVSDDEMDIVQAALNHYCSEEFQRAVAETGELPSQIPAIAKEYGAEHEEWAAAYPNTSEEFDALAYYPYEAYFADRQKIEETWDREILR